MKLYHRILNELPGFITGAGATVLLISCLACNRTVVGTDGKAYYKVAKNDYVQAQAIDSLNYTIQHYEIVNN